MPSSLRACFLAALLAALTGCNFSCEEPAANAPDRPDATEIDAAIAEADAAVREPDAAFELDAALADASEPDAALEPDAGAVEDAGAPRDAAIELDSGFPGPDPNDPTSDFDCDGVSDADEIAAGTNPGLADSDRDGIADGVELGKTTGVAGSGCPMPALDADPSTHTDPLDPDSDDDGISDGIEDRNHDGAVGPGELDPRARDSDRDGLPDAVEDRNRNGVRDDWETDATSSDTDGDGIVDGVEDLDHDGLLDAGESSPLFADTDFDGLPDGVEDANHDGMLSPGETSTTLSDTDLDGLSDGCEDRDHDGVRAATESDPREADTDFDGLLDAQEDADGDCTVDANETDPANSDTDCDGLSDFSELATVYAGGRKTNPLVRDTDRDLIPDGVEVGVRQAVPLSVCSGVALDLSPTTRTNPTVVDTDGDGRSDGCEDRNRNGRRDRGELDPLAIDTDGDGIPDAVEDANGNCAQDGNETSGATSDTDGDGIPDVVEIAVGTSPTLADTDGDGLSDGVEDANRNGVVEPNETDPKRPDSDGDGLADGVEDTNHDGTVEAGESDPRRADTDGDGLTDATERQRGTDPSDPDSDDDHLTDGDEVARGTSPTDSDTDNDTIFDGDEIVAGTDPLDPNDPGREGAIGINAICSTSGLKVIQFQDHLEADTQVALETSYTPTPVTVTRGDAALAFADNNLGIAGMLASIAPPAMSTNPTAAAQALIGRLTSSLSLLGASSVSVQNNGRAVTTHDGLDAVVDIRVRIALTVQASPAAVRNRVLAALSAHALADFGGLPGTGGGNATSYVLRFETVVRPATSRVLFLGAVVSEVRFNDSTTVHRSQVEDLSNGTALARAHATNSTGCDLVTSTHSPKADFIWMADISGSTDNDRGTIASAAGTIFSSLTNNGVDFRMGVVPHSSNHLAGVFNPGSLRGSGFTRDRQTFISHLNNTDGANGCEFGLTAADDALSRALPRTAVGAAESTRRLRADAQLVVFYISDEHAQEVEINICGIGNTGTGLTDIFSGGHEQNPPNATQQAAIDGIVAPFVRNIRNNGGIAFAQLHPLQAPFCFADFPNDEEEGYGYFDVVAATGGTFYRVCDSDPGAVLQDIIDAVTGAASEFVLQETPISSTIKVGITRVGARSTVVVPRSSVNGFDYDPSANAIFFRGATYRPAQGDKVTISYRIFQPPVPPVVCAAPLVLNTITNSCECPASCGLASGCGAGELCDRDPAVCACQCAADCGGTCTGSRVCDTATCGCVCAPNCGGACTGNQVCDQASCTCACPANCGGTCTGGRVCDPVSCTCACPADCGGCPAGKTCDVASCACVGGPL